MGQAFIRKTATRQTMLIRRRPESRVLPSEITPERIWRDRRRLLAQLGAGAAALALGRAAPAWALPDASLAVGKKIDLAGGEKINRFDDITHYNNFYEFGAYKSDPADNAHTLRTRPWTVEVGGACEAPARLGIDDILKAYPLEERIYRHRCVEGWSMVVPWDGFALGPFLRRFKPTAQAKFVAFQTLYDPAQMPQAGQLLPWPYREALRIDEAMHPLAFVSLGMYGQPLPAQDGAPLRLTLPWKYGFKSIKSIVRIAFVERAPDTTWNMTAPEEYGFYANVNPGVDHPRWSQATERRLGEFFKRPTLMFNGYPEVAPLYAGLDLRKFY